MDLNFTEKEIEELMLFYNLWIIFYYDNYKNEIEQIFKED